MKKKIAGVVIVAGFLLCASCGKQTEIVPVEPTSGAAVPTMAEKPTGTPKAEITSIPTDVPEPTVTKAVEPMDVPTPAIKPTEVPVVTQTPVPEPTKAEQPSEMPEPTEEALPTIEPEPTTEPVVEPTETPEPTILPELTETPIPTPSPTPVINPDQLVNQGWQKCITIDEKYSIIFPEAFRECVVIKDGNNLLVSYTCPEVPEIEFQISYLMKQTLEEVENAILSVDGTILEGSLGEKKVVLEWKQDDCVYRGILSEEQYKGTLLGDYFGEDEWITGVMQVTFAYPEERREEFETAEFSYHIKKNRED